MKKTGLSQAQRAQNADKQVKAKTVLNAHKTSKRKKIIKNTKCTYANKKDSIFVRIKRLEGSTLRLVLFVRIKTSKMKKVAFCEFCTHKNI